MREYRNVYFDTVRFIWLVSWAAWISCDFLTPLVYLIDLNNKEMNFFPLKFYVISVTEKIFPCLSRNVFLCNCVIMNHVIKR